MSDVELVFIVDVQTGKETYRAINELEIEHRNLVQSETQAKQTEQEALAKSRASAVAKLKKLGLTDKEIAAL